MKPTVASLLLLALTVPAYSEKLTNADLETLLEKVESLKESASSRADARFSLAVAAYRGAMATDAAAIAFYLKCIEKVEFEEKEKTYVDFREWKRKNDAKISDPAFKAALRYQLRWLVLTLQAASEDPDFGFLSREAINTVNKIMSEADTIGQQKNTLGGSVTSSVFAKAYDVDNVKVEDWPRSPFPIKPIFEKIVFPPMRTQGNIPALRGAWEKFIGYEGIVAEKWTDQKKPTGKNDEARKAAKKLSDEALELQYATFLKEKLPSLRWESEMDLYDIGDERVSAVRMISLIEKNPYHPDVVKWAEALGELLRTSLPEPGTGIETETDPSGAVPAVATE